MQSNRVSCAGGLDSERGVMADFGTGIDHALLMNLTPRDVLFDIGANLGDVSVLSAGIASKVVAFEPDPQLADNLRRRVSSLGNVTVEEVAVSDKIGRATFYQDTRPEFRTAGSLIVLSDLHRAGDALPVDVEISTIDAYCKKSNLHPTFMKIDVEGNEPAVIAGAHETIASLRPKIILEMWESKWAWYRETFAYLSSIYYLVRISDGADASAFYSSNASGGSCDILAIPL